MKWKTTRNTKDGLGTAERKLAVTTVLLESEISTSTFGSSSL